MSKYFGDSQDPLTQIYRAMGLFSEVSKSLKGAREERGKSALYKMNLILADENGRLKYPRTYNNTTLDNDIASMEALVTDGHINLDRLDSESRDFYNYHLQKLNDQKALNIEYDTAISSLEELEKNFINDINDFRDVQTTTVDRFNIIDKVTEHAKTYATIGDRLETRFGQRLKTDSYAVNQFQSFDITSKAALKQLRFDDHIIDDLEYVAIVNSITYNDPKIITDMESQKTAVLKGTAAGYVNRIQENAEDYETMIDNYSLRYNMTWGEFKTSPYYAEGMTEASWREDARKARLRLNTIQENIQKYQKGYQEISKGSPYNVILSPIPKAGGGTYQGTGISGHSTSTVTSVGGVKVKKPGLGLLTISENTFKKNIEGSASTSDLGARDLNELKKKIDALPDGTKKNNAKRVFNQTYKELNTSIRNLKSTNPEVAKNNPAFLSIKDLYPGLETY